mgnify:CR=1 FL=1
MDNIDKNLSNEFHIEPIIDIIPASANLSESTEIVGVTGDSNKTIDTNVEIDYDEIRKNIKSIIVKSNAAVDGILMLAKETDKPSAYEVAADLIRATLEANEKLMELHQKVKEIKNIERITSINNINSTNNSMYIGSTKDLLDIIKSNKLPVIQQISEPEKQSISEPKIEEVSNGENEQSR